MKEIGILMQPEMVLANLQDRKTETRRTRGLKEINNDIAAYEREEDPAPFTWELVSANIDPLLLPIGNNRSNKPIQAEGFYAFFHWTGRGDIWRSIKCPYGKPGDLLWVRECWNHVSPKCGEFYYKATEPVAEAMKWRPSIHMPKDAARIWLRVKEIKIERLNEITDEGAKSEGIFFTDYGRTCYHNGMNGNINKCPAPEKYHPQKPGWSAFPTKSHEECLATPRSAFLNLWDKINGEKLPSKINPYVWVVKYEVLSKNGRPDCVSQGT